MTEFSKAVVSCLVKWSKTSAECNGNAECLEQSAGQLSGALMLHFQIQNPSEFKAVEQFYQQFTAVLDDQIIQIAKKRFPSF